MTKTGKYALLGGGALVLFLLLRNSSSLSIPGLVTTTPTSTTAQNVTAAGTAAGSILSGLSSLFSGGTPSPVLSSGTTTNANDSSDNLTQAQALAAGQASYAGDPIDEELNQYFGSTD